MLFDIYIIMIINEFKKKIHKNTIMDNLRSIFLSKNNVSQLYQTFMVTHRLMNADVARI